MTISATTHDRHSREGNATMLTLQDEFERLLDIETILGLETLSLIHI